MAGVPMVRSSVDPERNRRKIGRRDVEDGEIGERIGTDEFGLVDPAVGQDDAGSGTAFHDVVVRGDVPRGVENDSGS